jgi:hypothetical protein
MRCKKLDQDKTFEILDQTVAETNIAVFVISYEESVAYFKRLENLEKIRCGHFTSCKLISPNKTKFAKSSQPTTELVVSLIVNHLKDKI